MLDYIPKLKDINEFEKSYLADQISVYVFSAPWCPDCLFLEPFMQELMNKYNHYSFLYIDRDEWLPLLQRLDIMGIPSFVGVCGGKEINRFVSKNRKTKQEIDTFLKNLETDNT